MNGRRVIFNPSNDKIEISYINLSLIILIPILVLACTLKPLDLFRDVSGYLDNFVSNQPLDLTEAIDLVINGEFGVEFFYGFISSVAINYGAGFRFVLFFYATIGVFFKFMAFSKFERIYWVVIVLYFASWFIVHDLIQIRAGAAIAICLYASYCYHFEGKRIFGLFLVVIATFFHLSSLLYIPAFMVCNFPSSFKTRRLLFFVCAMSLFFHSALQNAFDDVLSYIGSFDHFNKLGMYNERFGNGEYQGANAYNLKYVGILFLLGINVFFVREQSKENTVFFNFTALGYIFFNLFLNNPVLAFRVSELFLMYFIHLIAYTLNEIRFPLLRGGILFFYIISGLLFGVSVVNF